MKLHTSCLLIGACLLAGCWQKSLNPFFTARDVDYDAKLVGTWTEWKESGEGRKEKGNVWKFSDAADKRYALEINSDGDNDETNRYEAQLFQLDGHRLLDIVPTDRPASTIPAHHLFEVVALEPNLELASLNIDWMQKYLRSHPKALAHVAIVDPEHRDDREKDELVLTADTAALQKFLRDHWKEEDLFTEPTVLKRDGSALLENKTK